MVRISIGGGQLVEGGWWIVQLATSFGRRRHILLSLMAINSRVGDMHLLGTREVSTLLGIGAFSAVGEERTGRCPDHA